MGIVNGYRLARSAKLASISLDAMLAYAWVISVTHVRDDFGAFHYEPSLLRVICFPRRKDITDETMAAWLEEWVGVGLVLRYQDRDGIELGLFTNFRGEPDRRYHHFDLPASLHHSCTARCARSGRRYLSSFNNNTLAAPLLVRQKRAKSAPKAILTVHTVHTVPSVPTSESVGMYESGGCGGGNEPTIRSNPLIAPGERARKERELLDLVRREAQLTHRDPEEVMAEVSDYEGATRSKLNPATMTDDRLLNSILDARARVKRLETKHGRTTPRD